MKGSVVWFNSERGFGFIKPDAGDKDIFVHFTGIAGTGYRALRDGQRVEFAVEQAAKGPQAIDVTVFAENK